MTTAPMAPNSSMRFDNIIIGAGQAGPPLAARLTAAGQTVAFVERHLFGGTCVNTGCTPTKAMVASAYAAREVHRAAEYGILTSAPITDIARVQKRRDAIVESSRSGVEKSLRDNPRITVFTGTASFTAPHTLQVSSHTLTAPRIFLNVGCRASIPKIPGIDSVPFLDNTSLLALPTLPSHLIIVGGSYIGLEFAQMYRRFGSEVTVIEKSSRLVSHEDEDVSACVLSILEAEDIHVRLNADCIALASHATGVSVSTHCNPAADPVTGSHVLLAVGRTPNTADLGLSAAGIATDPKGFIVVDDQCRTNVDGIYALGDCNGRGAFTHTAYNDYEIVAANLLDNDTRKITDRIPCSAMYIDPPLAHIGMTEAEVRASTMKMGTQALIATRPMSRVNRALEKGESLGFMKVLVDAESKKILGATLLGVGCDEAIHSLLDIMYAGAPYTTISRAVHIHPTVSELLPTLLQALKPLA
jgi:pyruvate/2-oxoglutarate dehydrogenase complex dihydrolipoamide dehydrogenase (E3) component